MQYLLEGILFGLTLAILLGPIFIVLLQVSLERGTRAGLIAGAGIWISDFIIVSVSLYFINRISFIVQHDDFRFWMGLVGGMVLIGIGLGASKREVQLDFESSSFGKGAVANYFLKGFLVNTINPFTFIFWLTVISSYVATRKLEPHETYLFLGGILMTIVITDVLKVLLAKLIRERLNEVILHYINTIAAFSLIIFGFILLIKGVT